MEKVILVNKRDEKIGEEEKLAAHQKGQLHRAISIFIFNSRGELMLQQRAIDKYHCGGLWSNTCCTHPRVGETASKAAKRRLREEMGFQTELEEIFTFTYKKEFDNGLTENELDHVFIGDYESEPEINLQEAENWKWISLDDLEADVKANPEKYTYWFKKVYKKVFEYRNLD
jgi:isopentenyl-diphosphate delta-isomerase